MNKQIEIDNLETMIQIWEFAILSHKSEIQQARDRIAELRAQQQKLQAQLDDENKRGRFG